MASFGAIVQDPVIRALVQDNFLQREWHDALFPKLLFRLEANRSQFKGEQGTTVIETGTGLITPKTKPLQPGVDPTPSSYGAEQWAVTPQQYADSIDTHMPTSALALADMLMRNATTLGVSAGQSLDRKARNRLYNAGVSGATFAEASLGATGGNQTLNGGTGTLRVRYLNGFTKARRPDLPNGSAVQFGAVSANNPLVIAVTHTVGTLACAVVGFTPDNVGDETGPGVLSVTFTGGPFTVNDRSAVIAADATNMVRVGGGSTIDAVGATDVVTLASFRAANARLRSQNIPTASDGAYHCHLDPISESQAFSDAEFQRLMTSLPEASYYKDFALGRLLGTIFLRNNECPQVASVVKSGGFYTTDDDIAIDLTNATSVEVHHAIYAGGGALNESYIDLAEVLNQPAGFTGVVTDGGMINYDAVSVNALGVKMITRAPINRLQDQVSTSWSCVADWVCRTDITSGDTTRYKRMCVIEHGA